MAVKLTNDSRSPPTRNNFSSSNGFAIRWRPNGKPSWDNPPGSDIAGNPARLAGTVKISFKYIWIGSSIFSPIAKAASGVVGVRIMSTFLKASENL